MFQVHLSMNGDGFVWGLLHGVALCSERSAVLPPAVKIMLHSLVLR